MKKILRMAATIAALTASVGLAQQAGPREGRGERGEVAERGPGRGRGREFNPEQMRERMREFMSNRIKEQLKVSDEEWGVIEPLAEKVMEARRQTRALMIGRGVFGGPPPPEGGEAGAVRKATGALRQALENETTPVETLKARLEEVRAARAEAEAELKKAQEDLRAVLTVRQEAQFVLFGILD